MNIHNNNHNNQHLWALFKDAHWRSLIKDKFYNKDDICSHGLEANDIENLAKDLGLQFLSEELRENRKNNNHL